MPPTSITLDPERVKAVLNQFIHATVDLPNEAGEMEPTVRSKFIEPLISDLNDPKSLSYKAALYMRANGTKEVLTMPGMKGTQIKIKTPLSQLEEGWTHVKAIINDPENREEKHIAVEVNSVREGLNGLAEQLGKVLRTDLSKNEEGQLVLYKAQLDALIPKLNQQVVGLMSSMRQTKVAPKPAGS